MLSIGRRLRAAREQAGLSQAEVAEHFKTSRGAVGNWESGRHLPSLLQFRQLVTLYAASPYQILFGYKRPRLTDSERQEMEEFARKCSPGLRTKITLALAQMAVED